MIDKPLFRVAVAGLDPRDARLIEIVFKHSQYNRYEFRLVPSEHPDDIDILLANATEPEGLKAIARLRSAARSVPIAEAVPRGAASTAKHAIAIDRLTLQLLPMLNRVVEQELDAPDTRPMTHQVDDAAPTDSGFAETQPGPFAASPPHHGGQPASSRDSSAKVSAPERAGAAAGTLASPVAVAAATVGAAVQASLAMPGGATESRTAGASGRRDDRPPARPEPARRAPAEPTVARVEQVSPPRRAPVSAPAPAAQVARSARDGAADAGQAPGNDFVDREGYAQKIRVLIVDDSPTVRQQLATAFARMGASCVLAGDAASALERLESGHLDLAFVDVVMPDVDGYRLTREIRRRRRGLPVVILTSRSSPLDLARAALAGCDTFLVKPVPLRKLEEAIVKSLRKTLAIDDVGALLRLPSTWKTATGASAADRERGGGGPRNA